MCICIAHRQAVETPRNVLSPIADMPTFANQNS